MVCKKCGGKINPKHSVRAKNASGVTVYLHPCDNEDCKTLHFEDGRVAVSQKTGKSASLEGGTIFSGRKTLI